MRPARIIGIPVLAALLALAPAAAGPSGDEIRFPGKSWEVVKKAEDLGYSSAKLADARAYAETIQTAAVMVVVGGRVLTQWGNVSEKYLTHSVRKSFLSGLYGKYVRNGTIDLDRTMAGLGIDDEPPLTPQEKGATIRDCLKARSGVFHTAEAENEAMHNLKPERGTFRPGTFWIYNNWDFNVLGTIFEKLTGKKIFQAMKEDVADPIGMEDFVPEDGRSFRTNRSLHEAYMFVISARDCARYGYLFLRGGKWGDRQVIPADWVKESTTYFSDATIYGGDGYGYMWWVAKDHNRFPHFPQAELKEGTYSARGAGGQYIVVIPDRDMVVVHRVNTFEGHNVTGLQFGRLLKMILEARM
jgi:CubicO group peptidase (beta-lactamase class C family)